jgi:hypothetical protein
MVGVICAQQREVSQNIRVCCAFLRKLRKMWRASHAEDVAKAIYEWHLKLYRNLNLLLSLRDC